MVLALAFTDRVTVQRCINGADQFSATCWVLTPLQTRTLSFLCDHHAGIWANKVLPDVKIAWVMS